ncbi:MAG: hypothetical protein ACYDBH_17805 [Acidobacteriaceae bacterium]
MQVQHPINATDGASWYRCKRVVFENGAAMWELSRKGRYDLLAQYPHGPHRQLVESRDDYALRAFIHAWGPLAYSLTAWSGSDPIASYRRERDTLRAWVRLLTAIQKFENLGDAMIDLLRIDAGPFAIPIRGHLGLPGDLQAGFDDEMENRVAFASKGELKWICEYLVGAFPLPFTPAFRIDETGKGFALRAAIGGHSLVTALYWMVWQDIFMGNPFQFCEECHSLIPQTSRHIKKFCSQECAHRKTGRVWQQRKRKNVKKEREDVIKKTR